MNKEGARAIIFNGMTTHSSVVNKEECEAISAGFCVFKFNKAKGKIQVKCYGKSTSLGISSDSLFDQKIINRTLTRTHPLIGCYNT